MWVDANFKEVPAAQHAHRPAGRSCAPTSTARTSTYHGTVDGLGAGTGAAFALLPAQNATGNWIKVVQRVPVRVALDPKELAEHPLRVGLSMEADVDVDDAERQARWPTRRAAVHAQARDRTRADVAIDATRSDADARRGAHQPRANAAAAARIACARRDAGAHGSPTAAARRRAPQGLASAGEATGRVAATAEPLRRARAAPARPRRCRARALRRWARSRCRCATFMNVLDTSIANVSLPGIAGDLGVSPSQGTWVITSASRWPTPSRCRSPAG